MTIAILVYWIKGGVERAKVYAWHIALFMQAAFITVLLSIGCEDKRRLFAVAFCTMGCFAVSLAMEIWLSIKGSEE